MRNENNIPQSVKLALEKQRERIFLLKLDNDLVRYIEGLSENQGEERENHKEKFVIESHRLINLYFRLLGHQMCQYYQLQHWNRTDDIVVSGNDIDYRRMYEGMKTGEFMTVKEYLKGEKEKKEKKEKVKVKPRVLKREEREERQQKQQKEIEEKEISQNCIETERISKEEYYMKIREKIFEEGVGGEDGEGEDGDGEEGEDEEGEDEDEDEDYNNNNYNNNHNSFNHNSFNQNSFTPSNNQYPFPLPYPHMPGHVPQYPIFTPIPGPIPPFSNHPMPSQSPPKTILNPYIIMPGDKKNKKPPS